MGGTEVWTLLYDIKAQGGQTVASQANTAGNAVKTLGSNTKLAATAGQNATTNMNNFGNSAQTVATKGKAAGGVVSGLKNSFSGLGTKAMGFGLGIAGVASQIASLSDAYDNLQDTELKLQGARIKVNKSTTAIKAAEANLAKMRKEGKGNTTEYKIAEEKLNNMKDKAKLNTDQLANAEDDYQRAQRAFYLQVGPQIIGIGSQIAASVMLMKNNAGGAAEGMQSMGRGARVLSTALKAIPLIAIGAAILAIRNNTGGFRDMLESLGKKIGELVPQLKPLLDWLHSMAEALGLTGGKVDFAKAFDLLKTGFQGIIDTVLKMDWGKALQDTFDTISKWFQNADWAAVWKWFQDAVFAAGKWINEKLPQVYDAISKWIYDQDWAAVWKVLHDAVFAAGAWIGEQLGKIKAWIDANGTTALKGIGTAISNAIVTLMNSEVAKFATDAFNGWASNLITALGNAIVNGLKTATAFTKGGSVNTQLQTNFEDAGKTIDWIKVGGAWLYAAGVSVGAWEWKTFHKPLIAGLQTAMNIISASIDFSTSATNFIMGIGNAIGDKLKGGVQILLDAGKAIWLEIVKFFTLDNFKDGAGKFLDAFVAAVEALPDKLKQLGSWIWGQITGGLGALGQKFLEFLNGNKAEAATPGGSGTVQGTALTADDSFAKAAMLGVLNYWKRISGDIQGIIPALKADPVPANKSSLAVQEYWKRILGNIQGLIPQLKLDSKPATSTIDALIAVWRSKGQTITATVPALKVNSKPATDTINALVAVWQSKSKTMTANVPQIKANTAPALNNIQKVVDLLAKVKSKTITITANVAGSGKSYINKAAPNEKSSVGLSLGGNGGGLFGGGEGNSVLNVQANFAVSANEIMPASVVTRNIEIVLGKNFRGQR